MSLTMSLALSLPAFSAWSGARRPKALLLGEAWGQSESEVRKPFVGASGFLLFELLGEALPDVEPELWASARAAWWKFAPAPTWHRWRDEWLAAAGLAMTNVLACRPPGNDLGQFCCAKADLPQDYPNEFLRPVITTPRQLFLRPEFLPELARLYEEINTSQPNIILALGNTACWATLRATSVGSLRGTIAQSVYGVKTLPTYHPAGVLRQWAWRPIVIADLIKAWREAQSAELVRPRRRVLISPSLVEARAWAEQAMSASALAVDIETAAGLVTCIGFARARDDAMVVPFRDQSSPDGSIYPLDVEREFWTVVRRLLASPVPKIFQNGVYDLQYLSRMGIGVKNCAEDTMLLHHSIFPELQKGLGFLGSIYSNEPAWKLMRRHHHGDTTETKRDE